MGRRYPSFDQFNIPDLPEPKEWTDWEAWRLYRLAVRLKAGPGPGVVWSGEIQPQRKSSAYPSDFSMVPFPLPWADVDAEVYCRAVLNFLHSEQRVIEWQDGEDAGAVAELRPVGGTARGSHHLLLAWGDTLLSARLKAEAQYAGADRLHQQSLRDRLTIRAVGIDEASEVLEWLATPWEGHTHGGHQHG